LFIISSSFRALAAVFIAASLLVLLFILYFIKTIFFETRKLIGELKMPWVQNKHLEAQGENADGRAHDRDPPKCRPRGFRWDSRRLDFH
jgi:hypothetical protein